MVAVLPLLGVEAEPFPGPSCLSRGSCLLLSVTLLLPWTTCFTFNCHRTCVCASNIISCSKMNLTSIPSSLPLYMAVLDLSYNSISRLRAEWTSIDLPKLQNLILRHNGLNFISSEAFVHVTQLRYLDLSSNALQNLDEFLFEPLEWLEVLLLYDNRISHIDRTAFSGLASLEKLYLSQNLVTRFPLELVKDKTRLERLSLLDVSSNKVKVLPVQELQGLPAWIKNGLYYHDNPLVCNCELYNLLAHWHLRQLSSTVDFKNEYTCILLGSKKETVVIFDLKMTHMNCSIIEAPNQEAYLGQTLMLGCDTRHRDMAKTWVLPGNVSPGGNHSTAEVFPEGELRIGPVQAEDSGVYTCFAVGEVLNETLYVTVKVHNFTHQGAGETLNTAYTTLACCLASAILVLIYLYLTPCRCFCCRNHKCAKSKHEDSLNSSTFSATPINEQSGTRVGLGQHVAFINPRHLQGQNGKMDFGNQEGQQKKGPGSKLDVESISSVCSDTPIVV